MKRLGALIVAMATLCLLPAARAQTASSELAQAPASAETWSIISTAGQHGTSRLWTTPDGARWSREQINLRGFVTDIDQQVRFAADGSVASLEVRGSTPSGDAAERFTVNGARYDYTSPVGHGDGAYAPGAFYVPFGGSIDATITLIDALRRAPNHQLDFLPSGRASLVELTTHQVSNGHETKTLTAYALVGATTSPIPVWYNGDHFFAQVGVLSWAPVGWEGVVDDLSRAQDEALAQRSAALVDRIAPRAAHAVVFRNVRVYDSERRRFLQNRTVVINDGRIVSVGTGQVRVPEGAEVIDGAGDTLVPGLWDSHQHFGDDSAGPFLLAQGITSIRDPGNQPEQLMARRARINAGQLIGPRIVSSMLIDGRSEYTAQVAVVATTEAEAIAAVNRAHDAGYAGVKFYGSVNPDWVAPMAAEAHRLGLRVHGHIPAGMRPLDAIRAGYDEITHINFVMMQAMPDDVVNHSNGYARHIGTAQFAPDVDLRSPAMRAYLNELAQRHVAVDPTLSVFETEYLPNQGQIAPAYAPYVGTLPPLIERGFYAGGLPETPEVSRQRMIQAQAKLAELVGELHRRRVSIVAGTDGSGLELVRELELYVAAGMSPADALATATIVPARLFGVGDQSGAIRPGMLAEVTLVRGDPSRSIGDLRNVLVVMRDGRLMQASALRDAIGISGPPHPAQ